MLNSVYNGKTFFFFFPICLLSASIPPLHLLVIEVLFHLGYDPPPTASVSVRMSTRPHLSGHRGGFITQDGQPNYLVSWTQ